MAMHNLKIDALPFADLLSGAKTGEVRNDDRGFEVGDTVHLTCIDGQTMDLTISHIQRGYGLPDGICVLSYTRRAATAATDTGLVTVSSKDYDFYEDGELVTRSQAEAIIAAKDATLQDAINCVKVLTDEKNMLEATNAALTARVKEMSALIDGENCADPDKIDALFRRAETAETQLAAAKKALEFYGDVSKYPAPLTGGMGALRSDCGAIARAALEAKP